MGGSLEIKSFPSCSAKELDVDISNAIDQDSHEYGHGPYSGHWAEKRGSGWKEIALMMNSQDAEEYCAEHSDKWGPLLAIKTYRMPSVDTASIDKKLGELHLKIRTLAEIAERRSLLPESIGMIALARAKAGKSSFKACDDCGSRLRIGRLSHNQCPVCGNLSFLLNASDEKKLDNASKKITSLEDEMSKLKTAKAAKEANRKKPKNINDWFWTVGGWCSC